MVRSNDKELQNSAPEPLKLKQSVAGFASTVKKIHYCMIHLDWEEKSFLNIIYRDLCFSNFSARQDAIIIFSISRA